LAFTLKVHDTFVGTFSDPIAGRVPDTLGSAWGAVQGGGAVSIGLNYAAFPASANTWIINTTPLANNQAVEGTTPNAGGGGNFINLVWRADASGNGYMLMCRPNIFDDVLLWKMVGGSFTNLGSQTGIKGSAWPAGTLVRVEMIGTAITVYVDGVLKWTTGDATYASGFAGMFGDNGGSSLLDNFKAFDDAGGGGGTTHNLAASVLGTLTVSAALQPIPRTLAASVNASLTVSGALTDTANIALASAVTLTLNAAGSLSLAASAALAAAVNLTMAATGTLGTSQRLAAAVPLTLTASGALGPLNTAEDPQLVLIHLSLP
jgi:hypothetical protein